MASNQVWHISNIILQRTSTRKVAKKLREILVKTLISSQHCIYLIYTKIIILAPLTDITVTTNLITIQFITVLHFYLIPDVPDYPGWEKDKDSSLDKSYWIILSNWTRKRSQTKYLNLYLSYQSDDKFKTYQYPQKINIDKSDK